MNRETRTENIVAIGELAKKLRALVIRVEYFASYSEQHRAAFSDECELQELLDIAVGLLKHGYAIKAIDATARKIKEAFEDGKEIESKTTSLAELYFKELEQGTQS